MAQKKVTQKSTKGIKNLKAKRLSADSARRVRGGGDIFKKLGDIKGESLDDKHKDEIEVLSYRRR
jgi:type VI protein secretion system component Hcp